MKFIFDFDDVLFDTRKFKEFMFSYVEKSGTSRAIAEKYYKEVRAREFSLKEFLAHFSIGNMYEEIMQECPNFLNTKLIEVVKNLGKENCFIVTNGDKEFQKDKIKRNNIGFLFYEIHIVPESKKELVEKICDKYKNEQIMFIDDKDRFFENLDFKKYPNLKTILFDEHGFEQLQSIAILR